MQLSVPDLVVVTGSASGLGEVIATSCLSAGAQVVGVDVDDPRPVLDDERGYRHVKGSVVEEPTWGEALERIADVGPTTTVGYVACAAILVQGTPEQVPLASWRRILDVNVVGAALGMSALVERMADQGGGAMVLIGSVDAQFGEETLTAYAASKGGLRQLARSAALDYGPRRIRVNMVSPGPMLTEMFFVHAEASDDPAAFRSTREARQPLGEILDPQLVANAVIFMLADQSAGMTGTDIVVDGGLTAGFDFRNLPMRPGDTRPEVEA